MKNYNSILGKVYATHSTKITHITEYIVGQLESLAADSSYLNFFKDILDPDCRLTGFKDFDDIDFYSDVIKKGHIIGIVENFKRVLYGHDLIVGVILLRRRGVESGVYFDGVPYVIWEKTFTINPKYHDFSEEGIKSKWADNCKHTPTEDILYLCSNRVKSAMKRIFSVVDTVYTLHTEEQLQYVGNNCEPSKEKLTWK